MPPLLEARDIEVRFPVGGGLFRPPEGFVHAVGGVSLALEPGEVVAVVWESGCGKTTLARTVLGLTRPTGGTILDRKSVV
jgi:ABC-type oligopeptide transport system ATPase subunit